MTSVTRSKLKRDAVLMKFFWSIPARESLPPRKQSKVDGEEFSSLEAVETKTPHHEQEVQIPHHCSCVDLLHAEMQVLKGENMKLSAKCDSLEEVDTLKAANSQLASLHYDAYGVLQFSRDVS